MVDTTNHIYIYCIIYILMMWSWDMIISQWEMNHGYLVGGLEHDFYFSIQLGIIIPTDFHIFQRGWNHHQYIYMYYCVLYYIHIDDVWWFMMIFWWIYIFDYPFVFNIMMIADLLALNTTKQTLSGRWWTRSVDIILVELTILCSFLWI
jgi:hypothetical protein